MLVHAKHLIVGVDAGRGRAGVVVDFSDGPHGAGGVNGHVHRDGALALELTQKHEDLLRPPHHKDGDEGRAPTRKHLSKRLSKAGPLLRAAGLFGGGLGAVGRFQDQHVGAVRVLSPADNRLGVHVGIARVKDAPLAAPLLKRELHPHGAQNVPGRVKLAGDRRGALRPSEVEGGPEVVRKVEVVQALQVILGKEGLVGGFAPLQAFLLEAGRGRQQEVEQLLCRVGHVRHHVRKTPHQHRQAAHVVVVGVGDEGVVDVAVGPLPHPVEARQ